MTIGSFLKMGPRLFARLLRLLSRLLPTRLLGIVMEELYFVRESALGVRFTVSSEMSWRRFSAFITAEPLSARFFESFAHGKVFWDVGACLGTFSAMASKKGSTVVAFEANPINLASLEFNISSNNPSPESRIVAAAIGKKEDFITIKPSRLVGVAQDFTEGVEELSYCLPVMNGKNVADLKLPLPNSLKIDVDGMETEVLEILCEEDFLKECEICYVEISDNQLKDCQALLSRVGFEQTARDGENYLFENSRLV